MKEPVIRKGLSALLLAAALALLSPAVGRCAQAPQFSISAVNQSTPITLSDYRGKVVLIDFWATWCPPCRQEIPSLIALQRKFGPKGFTVIGLSMDEGGSWIVARFIKRVGINYPVAIANDEVTEKYGGVVGIPASFLIDRDGAIVKSYTGFVPHEVMEKDVAALVNAK